MRRTLTALLLLPLVAGAGAAQDVIAVKAARVHLGTGAVLEPGTVLVSRGRITGVGGEVAVPEGARVVDLGALELTPGLVDAATHEGLPRGRGENEESSEITPRYRASAVIDGEDDGLRRLQRSGVTTVGVHPGARNVVAGFACAVKTAGEDGYRVLADRLGLRINLGPDVQLGNTRSFRGPTLFTRLPTSRMDTVFLLRDAFQDARTYRARREAGGHPRDEDVEVLLEVLDGKLPVFWMARDREDVAAALQVAREFGIGHSVLVDCWEAHLVADELAAADVKVVSGPLFHPQYRRRGRPRGGRHFVHAAPERLRRAGVLAGLSAGGSGPGTGLMDGLRFATRSGLPAERALYWVTLGPAEALGVAERVGSVAAGKDADLVAFDGDPLAATSAVRWVMIDGRVVHGDAGRETAPEEAAK